MLAEAMLDNAMLNDIASKWSNPSPTAAHHKDSELRACSALGANHTSLRCRSRRHGDELDRIRLREPASVGRRFGYRRLHILLSREGIVIIHKKRGRLYREERPQVRRRSGRKQVPGTRAPMAPRHCPPARGLVEQFRPKMVQFSTA
jgi:putative transposase